MKKLILFLLFTTAIFGQGKLNLLFSDDDYYRWTAITGTNITTSANLILYGNSTKIKTTKDLGATSASKYIVWKVTGGVYDSTRTLILNINLDNLPEDTTGTYYCSVLDRNGRYSKGADSTFTTPISSGLYSLDGYKLYSLEGKILIGAQ